MPATPSRSSAYFHREVLDFAARHYSDPELILEDAAIFLGVSGRTLRAALTEHNTTWMLVLLDLRLERARELLSTTTYKITDVARLSGYNSPPALAKAFALRFKATPSQYRRGQGGPARAGGATGAFRSARRKHRDESPRTGFTAGEEAVNAQYIWESSERLRDRNLLEHGFPSGISIAEMADAWGDPVRMRDDPELWRGRRRKLDAYIEANNAPRGV